MRLHFPSPGTGLGVHEWITPEESNVDAGVVPRLHAFLAERSQERGIMRWALWRGGRLLHVEGAFDAAVDVASLRKTWHAMSVGAALRQGLIPSLDEPISRWVPELAGKGAWERATWRHVLTQASGFDYPYGDWPAFEPGEMWTYSDLNLMNLNHALARVYGKRDFYDHYEDVLRAAYFDAIGLEGWATLIKVDDKSGMEDGVRLVLSLEHMGRLGILALAAGRWADRRLVSEDFVMSLETKQTQGMRVNYNGPNDGTPAIGGRAEDFPEVPYGFLTWVNTDGDYFPGADGGWAAGRGAGGTMVLWNRRFGFVFAGIGVCVPEAEPESVPQILEAAIRTK